MTFLLQLRFISPSLVFAAFKYLDSGLSCLPVTLPNILWKWNGLENGET